MPLNLLYKLDGACSVYSKYIPQIDREYGPIKNVVKTAEIKDKFGYCAYDKTCYIYRRNKTSNMLMEGNTTAFRAIVDLAREEDTKKLQGVS